jgi:hypothetical protein
MAKKHETAPPSPAESPSIELKMDEVGSRLATVAVVGLGVALIEAELIPGMLIGIGAMLAPNLMSKFGAGLRPLIKGAMRAGYALAEKAKETVAEASEQYQDMVAEVHSEQDRSPAGGRR